MQPIWKMLMALPFLLSACETAEMKSQTGWLVTAQQYSQGSDNNGYQADSEDIDRARVHSEHH